MVISKCYRQRFMWVLACLIVHSCLARAADHCGSVQRIVAALSLSRALYPGLRGTELRVTISDGYLARPAGATDGRAFRLFFEKPTASGKDNSNLDQSSTNHPGSGAEDEDIDLNNIQFDFFALHPLNNDIMCPPVGLMVLTHDDRIDAAEELALQHPQWSDDELVSALKKQGLRFGPHDKAALMKILPLKQIQAYYGPLRIKEVSFSLLNEEQRKVVGKNFMELRWHISTTELRTKRDLGLNVDAFTGRIRNLGETKDAETHSTTQPRP